MLFSVNNVTHQTNSVPLTLRVDTEVGGGGGGVAAVVMVIYCFLQDVNSYYSSFNCLQFLCRHECKCLNRKCVASFTSHPFFFFFVSSHFCTIQIFLVITCVTESRRLLPYPTTDLLPSPPLPPPLPQHNPRLSVIDQPTTQSKMETTHPVPKASTQVYNVTFLKQNKKSHNNTKLFNSIYVQPIVTCRILLPTKLASL